MADSLVALITLEHAKAPTPRAEAMRLVERLAAAGYTLRADPDIDGYCHRRARHAGCVRSLAEHLGSAEAPLILKPHPHLCEGGEGRRGAA